MKMCLIYMKKNIPQTWKWSKAERFLKSPLVGTKRCVNVATIRDFDKYLSNLIDGVFSCQVVTVSVTINLSR